ncbi:MAG: DUF309 domain-containing protein [Planctomycetales bacterium]
MVPPKRYLPDEPFPPYAYVPGKQPHPASAPRDALLVSRDAKALRSGARDQPPPPREFLHGLDLFNHGYYWEAHEAWENLWHEAGRRGPTADALKGLIALAAAGVKAREGNAAGVKHHAERAAALFTKVRDECGGSARPIELSLPALIAHAEALAREPIVDETPTIEGRCVFPFRLTLESG